MSSPSEWVEASHKVAFRMNPQDRPDLQYICIMEAIGQAVALANILSLETKLPTT